MHSQRTLSSSPVWLLALLAGACAVDWEGQVAEGVGRRRAAMDAGAGANARGDEVSEAREEDAAGSGAEPVEPGAEPAEPEIEPVEADAEMEADVELLEPEPDAGAAAPDAEAAPPGAEAVEVATSVALVPADALLWFSADRGLSVDAHGRVLAWESQAGQGIAAFAESEELAPGVERDTALPRVTFDGTQELRVATLAPIRVLTFFAVAEAGVEDRRCPSILHLSNSQDGISQMADLEFGRHQRELYYESGAKSVPLGVMHTNSFSINALHVLSVRHEPDGLAVTRLDGRDVHSRVIDLPLEVERSHNFIGHNHYYLNGALSCERFRGRVTELLLYARVLDESERSQVERYLSEKWSVALQADL